MAFHTYQGMEQGRLGGWHSQMPRDFPVTLVIWTLIEGGFQKERQVVLLCSARPAVVKLTWSGHVGGLESAQGAALLERVGSLEEVDGLGVHHWMGT